MVQGPLERHCAMILCVRALGGVALSRPSLQCMGLHNRTLQHSSLPKTSLSEPPWPETKLPDPIEEAEQHKELLKKINNLIATGQCGRLFAVIYFSNRQWKVTNEDLISLDCAVEAQCGDRIRLEKVLLVGSEDFTLIGKPLLGKDLVSVEATVIEKTESQPKIIMKFWRRHGYQRKKWSVTPQTVLRINTIELAPALS
ncbi:39S ribosomal L21, mitochondrial [Pelobates cultripes]|uniref:Large ribosomal subunit protein bL21m n=2 Tax=Pelobates cultripes TaxID=61616 RepID=A0AAD1WU69_PELCU|nr:39S ribosomal L21, mitochondrial [Pelobates cultripes]